MMRFKTFAEARDWFLARVGVGRSDEATKRPFDRAQGGRRDEGVKAGPAIAFFTTDELVDELLNRSPGIVIGYIRHEDPLGFRVAYGGAKIAAMGLAVQVLRDVRAAVKTEDSD